MTGSGAAGGRPHAGRLGAPREPWYRRLDDWATRVYDRTPTLALFFGYAALFCLLVWGITAFGT